MIDRKEYRALFFDADDTLFDYQRAETEAFAATMSNYGFEDSEGALLRIYQRHNALLWKALERGEISQDDLKIERFRKLLADVPGQDLDPAELSVQYLRNLGAQTWLIEGAEETVSRLASRFILVLVTNGLTSVQKPRFAATPMVRHFSTVLISEELGVAKPDPAIFESAMDEHGLCPADVLLIGDGISSDMIAARNANMDFCWMNPAAKAVPEGFSPVAEIRKPLEILPLLGIEDQPDD